MNNIYYRNKLSYFLVSALPVDTSKLIDVTVIHDIEQAEREFRDINDLTLDDGVFIPSIFEQGGVVFAEGMNACAAPISTSIEDYINNYDM